MKVTARDKLIKTVTAILKEDGITLAELFACVEEAFVARLPTWVRCAMGSWERLLLAPTRCPFCGHDHMDASNYDGGDNETTFTTTCCKCGSSWTEGHRLAWASDFNEG